MEGGSAEGNTSPTYLRQTPQHFKERTAHRPSLRPFKGMILSRSASNTRR
jgi:hypothetical protein